MSEEKPQESEVTSKKEEKKPVEKPAKEKSCKKSCPLGKVAKVMLVVVVVAAVAAIFFFVRGGQKQNSAQAEVMDLWGPPAQFALSYVPQEIDGEEVLARNEVWIYPTIGKKLTFIGGGLALEEDVEGEMLKVDATSLDPSNFHFDMTMAELDGELGKENIEAVDYLPGFFNEGEFETYLSDKAIFIFEGGKLTYFQTFGVEAETAASVEEKAELFSLETTWLVPEAQAKIRLKNAFRCLGRVCKFVINLPDKVTKPLGPVLGPAVSMILTKNIAKHKNLGRIFRKAKKIKGIMDDVKQQKELVGELKGFYSDAAKEMRNAAQEIKNSRQDMLAQLTKKGSTYKEYKEHVMALSKLASSFEEGAQKFENQANNINVKNILKLLGKGVATKVLGQAKDILMSNVSRELTKLVNVDVLESLMGQDGSVDAIIDLLVAGDLKKALGNKDDIDIDDLKKRIREEIKAMIKSNKEDLRKNWKQKIAQIVDKKMAELKKEVGEYADQKDEALKKEEEEDYEEVGVSDFCLGNAKPTSEQCDPGYHFERMSGVGCVQTDCKEGKIPNAHPSYTGQCVCGSSGSINENPDDPNKECMYPLDCGPCPGCVYACVGIDEECPEY